MKTIGYAKGMPLSLWWLKTKRILFLPQITKRSSGSVTKGSSRSTEGAKGSVCGHCVRPEKPSYASPGTLEHWAIKDRGIKHCEIRVFFLNIT